MSKLPNDRLSVGEKPFSKMVVDYFGPPSGGEVFKTYTK